MPTRVINLPATLFAEAKIPLCLVGHEVKMLFARFFSWIKDWKFAGHKVNVSIPDIILDLLQEPKIEYNAVMNPDNENPLYVLQDLFVEYLRASNSALEYAPLDTPELMEYLEHIRDNQTLKRFTKKIILPLAIKSQLQSYLIRGETDINFSNSLLSTASVREAISAFHRRLLEEAKLGHYTLKPRLFFDYHNFKVVHWGTKNNYDFVSNTYRWQMVKALKEAYNHGMSRAMLVKHIGKDPSFDTARKSVSHEIKDINAVFKKRTQLLHDLIIKNTNGTTTYFLNFESYELYP